MGRGIITITMEAAGTEEEWSVQHPVNYGLSLPGITGALTAGDIAVSGIFDPMTEANTRIGAPGTFQSNSAPIVHRLVAFHRHLMFPDYRITKVEINDGRKNTGLSGGSGGAPPMFAVQDGLNLPGALAYPSGKDYAHVVGGSVALLINRQSQTAGVGNGRFYLRGRLLEDAVTAAGKRLLAFNSSTIQNEYAAEILTLQSSGQANLAEYFANDFIELGWRLGIAHYAPDNALDGYQAGDLVSITPCIAYRLKGVTVRQLARGRKRKQTP